MSVSIDEELARDLIQNKLRDIDDTISKILKKWDFETLKTLYLAPNLAN